MSGHGGGAAKAQAGVGWSNGGARQNAQEKWECVG
jgi:hypothetical protein